MLSGIYVITNKATRRLYVGSSSDIKKRFGVWANNFITKKRIPQSMLEDLNAGSPSDFIFKFVRECSPRGDALNKHENEVIKTLEKKYPGRLYNYASPCRSHKKVSHADDDAVREILKKGKSLDTPRFSDHSLLKHKVNGVSAYALAKQNGISDPLFYTRINKYGWDVTRACTEPPRTYPKLAPKDKRRLKKKRT